MLMDCAARNPARCGGRPIEFDRNSTGQIVGLETARFVDPIAVAVILDPERVRQRLYDELAATADDLKASIPTDARPELLRAIEAELAATERLEEGLISAAAAVGVDIPRRGDTNPLIALHVERAADAFNKVAAE